MPSSLRLAILLNNIIVTNKPKLSVELVSILTIMITVIERDQICSAENKVMLTHHK